MLSDHTNGALYVCINNIFLGKSNKELMNMWSSSNRKAKNKRRIIVLFMFSIIWREEEWNYWALKHKGIFDSWQFTHLKVGKKWERRYRLISFFQILKEPWKNGGSYYCANDDPVEKLFKCRNHRRSPPALLFGTLSLDFRSLFLDI